MDAQVDDRTELNIFDLSVDFVIQIFEYLNNWDFRALYEAHRQFHDAIDYAVRHKCLVLPLKWKNESDGYHQLENIKFFLEKFPLKLYSLNLNPEIENLENVRRITEQFNENVNQVNGEIAIMNLNYDDDAPESETVDFFKNIKINLCEKVHYFAVLATTEQLSKMNLLEHVTPREIRYLESLIALSKSDTAPDAATYYAYMQVYHKLYGLLVLNLIPSVEILELSRCRLDSQLALQLKNLPHLVELTLTDVKQTSELELFLEDFVKQNKLMNLSLHSNEQNLPSQIICQNLSKMTNLQILHLSIKGIAYETFLPEIAVNLKNLSNLEIITRDEFKIEWILDFLRVADNIFGLELDFNHGRTNWMNFYDELVQLRTSQGKTEKLDITIFGAVEGLDSQQLALTELVEIVLTPVVDREEHFFASRYLMSLVWMLEALRARNPV